MAFDIRHDVRHVWKQLHDSPLRMDWTVKSLRVAGLLLLAAATLWRAAIPKAMPPGMAACSHAPVTAGSPPQFAAPSRSDFGNAWSDPRVSFALPAGERPALPRPLPLFCGAPCLDGPAKVEEGVLRCASVHPPPLA